MSLDLNVKPHEERARRGRPPSSSEWEPYIPLVLGRGLAEGVSISKGGILVAASIAGRLKGPRILIMVNRKKGQVGLSDCMTEGYKANFQAAGGLHISCKGAVTGLKLKIGRHGATWDPVRTMVIIEEAIASE